MAGSLLHVIVSSLHDLAAITWVGAVLVNSLVVIPTFRRAPEDERVKRQLMMRVQKRMSFLIPPSIVVVVVTGVALTRFSPAFHGFFSFVNTYSMILTAKMFLTILMIVIMVLRQAIMKRLRSGRASVKEERLSTTLVHVNAMLGVLIILLSGALSAVA